MSKSKNNIKDSIASIRKFYEAGRESLKLHPDDDAYGKKVVEEEAKRLGLIQEMVRKARQLARETDGYNVDELKALFTMMQANPGTRFRKTHVIRLLTVKDKKQRAKMQRRAIEDSWTTAQLRIELNSLFGPRKHGGRRPSVLRSREGVITQLESFAEQWRRYGAALKERVSTPKKAKTCRMEDLGETIEPLLSAVLAAIDALQLGLAEELKKIHPKREGRQARPGDDKDVQ